MSIPEKLETAIKAAVREAYGGASNPWFGFAGKRYDRKPYQALIESLQESLKVEEDTDLNDDVCVSLGLSGGTGKWFLQLSLVGRYAAFMRLEERQKYLKVITEDTSDVVEPEQAVLDELRAANIEVLGQDIMEEPWDLVLHNTDPENTCIYQVLFSDVEGLPWGGYGHRKGPSGIAS